MVEVHSGYKERYVQKPEVH
jgi:hypothetical protein